MYRRPTRRRRSALAPILAAMLILGLLSMPFLMKHSADAAGLKIVTGHVYDSVGTPVAGADVTVNMKNGMIVRKTLTNITSATGSYRVTFSDLDWAEGDTIEVIADIDDPTNSSTATANPNPSQIIDVNLSIEIPELQTYSAVVLFAGATVLFFSNYRRKNRLRGT